MYKIHIMFKQNLKSIKNYCIYVLSLIGTPLDIGVIYICVYNIILLNTHLMYNSCYVNKVGLRVVDVLVWGGDSNNLLLLNIKYFVASIYDNFFLFA